MKILIFPAAVLFSLAPVHGADPVYRNLILSHNPVAYYEFDETEGTTAVDSSGNGRDGSFTGSLGLGVPSGAVNLGSAVDFTGGHVELPDLGTYPQSSFETWIQLDQVNGGCCTGILAATGWTTGRVHINVTFGLFEHAVNSDSAEVVRAATAPVPGEWYHLVVTNDVAAGETKFYLNGIEVSDDGDHGIHDVVYGPQMQIGAWDGTRQLDGRLDELAIYDSVLSPEEVSEHFATASGPAGTSLEITGIHYQLDSGSAPLVSLSWRSIPGVTYRVRYSHDLITWEGELGSGIEGDSGDLTTREFDLSGLAGEKSLFFRVEESN